MIIETYKGKQCIVGAGLFLMNQNHIWLGNRTDGQGWCTAGGKVEENETPLRAAIRECKEEFNLFVDSRYVRFRGTAYSQVYVKGVLSDIKSYAYLCYFYGGPPEPNMTEISEVRLVPIKDMRSMTLFPSTRACLDLL